MKKDQGKKKEKRKEKKKKKGIYSMSITEKME